MNLETTLDRLVQGESVQSALVDSTKIPGLGEAYFQRLILSYGSDPEALAQLGSHWSALVKRAEDSSWVYRAGGVYERSQGRWNSSAKAFIRAGETAGDPISRKSFAVGAIDSLARAGKIDEATSLARRLSTGLRKEGQPGLAARALLNLGNALVYQDRMPEARRVLLKALPDLEAAGLNLEAASARLALSSTSLFGGVPRQAEEYALQVIEAAKLLEAPYLADLARLNHALALIVTGRPEDAHRLLEELAPEFGDSPVDLSRVGEYKADALARLNLWSEAEEAYRDVLAGEIPLIPLHAANVELGLGQVLLAQGRLQEASEHLRRAERAYEKIQNAAWSGACLHALAVVDIESGNRKRALARLAKAEDLTQDSPHHLAAILLTQSRLNVDRIDEAHRLIRKYGFLDLEWQVHALLAARSSSPGRHYRQMFQSILSGRMSTSSVAARMGFLKDKTDALQAYMGWLLERPTKARVAEAIRAIQQIRSVTLLDEIMRSGKVEPAIVERLAKARAELESGSDQDPRGGTRSAATAVAPYGRAQRHATEALLALDVSALHSGRQTATEVILAETSRGLQILHRGRARLPSMVASELREALRWLTYELMAPMANVKASSAGVNRILDRLAKAFDPIWNSGAGAICPDGYTWRIPWTLCGLRAGLTHEWNLAMHPQMQAVYSGPLTSESRALVWLGQSPDLPFVRMEAELVASLFPSCKMVTSAAEARDSLSGNFDLVHVVSHAVHRPQNPMLSSIVFPDGQVFAYEIARSDMTVKLACLSACETGTLSLVSRSEPDGIARAFMARGAESVVASQWPLDDEAAFRQFDAFYRSTLENSQIRSALLNARCICKDWNEHPYYWGALALYSGFEA